MANNFRTLFLKKQATMEEIIDFVGEWHDDDNILIPLHTFLGLSEEEYNLWVEQGDDALAKQLKNS